MTISNVPWFATTVEGFFGVGTGGIFTAIMRVVQAFVCVWVIILVNVKFFLPEQTGRQYSDQCSRSVKHKFWDMKCVLTVNYVNRDLKIRGRRRQGKSLWKSEFAFFQSSLRILQVTNFVKCRWTLLKLNSWEPYPSPEIERKFRRRLCTSSVKREIRHFHVTVVQWRQRNVQKSDARALLLFWLLNLLLFWCSRFCRSRRILRPLLSYSIQFKHIPFLKISVLLTCQENWSHLWTIIFLSRVKLCKSCL